jgi:hypothetical protein
VAQFGTVTGEEIRAAQIITGVTMALFIGIGIAPGLREHAGRLRLALLVLYLLACGGFVGYVLLR